MTLSERETSEIANPEKTHHPLPSNQPRGSARWVGALVGGISSGMFGGIIGSVWAGLDQRPEPFLLIPLCASFGAAVGYIYGRVVDESIPPGA